MKSITANGRWAFLLIAGAGILAYGYHTHQGFFHHSPPPDLSAQIQANIGADSCSSSGYYLTSKFDNSKTIIYDCQMPSGNYKCVTESGGIDTDSTAIVKVLFANTLGSTKPTCVS